MSDEKTNNGGPAFPVTLDHRGCVGAYGMNLRDWFAGQALTGILSNQTLLVKILENVSSDMPVNQAIASNSLIIADAMIAARNS